MNDEFLQSHAMLFLHCGLQSTLCKPVEAQKQKHRNGKKWCNHKTFCRINLNHEKMMKPRIHEILKKREKPVFVHMRLRKGGGGGGGGG